MKGRPAVIDGRIGSAPAAGGVSGTGAGGGTPGRAGRRQPAPFRAYEPGARRVRRRSYLDHPRHHETAAQVDGDRGGDTGKTGNTGTQCADGDFGGYTLAVLDTAGRVAETVGPFDTPAIAEIYAREAGIDNARVTPHRHAPGGLASQASAGQIAITAVEGTAAAELSAAIERLPPGSVLVDFGSDAEVCLVFDLPARGRAPAFSKTSAS